MYKYVIIISKTVNLCNFSKFNAVLWYQDFSLTENIFPKSSLAATHGKHSVVECLLHLVNMCYFNICRRFGDVLSRNVYTLFYTSEPLSWRGVALQCAIYLRLSIKEARNQDTRSFYRTQWFNCEQMVLVEEWPD